MPEQIRCPSCQSALRVPETLVGQNVKCPKCATTFLAEMEETPHSEHVAREPRPAVERPRLPDPDYADDEEDYRRPRRRFSRNRAEAESLVAGPGTALLVVGIIDIFLAILNLLLPILGIHLFGAAGGGRRGGGDPEMMINVISGAISGVIGLIMGPLIIYGAVKMKQLNNYGMAMTASILAMIPCGNCCLLGLPFGIWALVMLNKPEVKDGFS